MIRYDDAPDIRERILSIANNLDFQHIRPERLVCIRSRGSSSRGIIARCHALPKIMQKALNVKAYYIIEVLSEKFDRMPQEEQTKTLIHELMHIPKCFGGGFIHHNMVNSATINKLWKKLKEKESQGPETPENRRYFV